MLDAITIATDLAKIACYGVILDADDVPDMASAIHALLQRRFPDVDYNISRAAVFAQRIEY